MRQRTTRFLFLLCPCSCCCSFNFHVIMKLSKNHATQHHRLPGENVCDRYVFVVLKSILHLYNCLFCRLALTALLYVDRLQTFSALMLGTDTSQRRTSVSLSRSLRVCVVELKCLKSNSMLRLTQTQSVRALVMNLKA